MKSTRSSSRSFNVALLCGLLALAPSFVEGANLVSNSSFEDNADLLTNPLIPEAPLTGWTKTESPGVDEVDGLGTLIPFALAPHTGNIAATFYSINNAPGGGASLSQAIVTDPTKTYDLSLWVANPIQDAGNFNNLFSVSWNGALISLSGSGLNVAGVNTYTVTPQTNWFQVTASGLAATGASTTLEIFAKNQNWGTLVDDVSVQEVSASGVPDSGETLGLFGIALAGLVLFQRKAQRDPLTVSISA